MDWEQWYQEFVCTIMPDEMAEEYLRLREIRAEFQDLTKGDKDDRREEKF